uniref:Uncharacterized protein n=1 Tax=Megaselia scalaris TaxID=36166 RepID=T1GNQ3_MEGSC
MERFYCCHSEVKEKHISILKDFLLIILYKNEDFGREWKRVFKAFGERAIEATLTLLWYL